MGFSSFQRVHLRVHYCLKKQHIGKVNFGQYGTFNMGPGGDVLLVEVDNARI